jgi:hypothetical protein
LKWWNTYGEHFDWLVSLKEHGKPVKALDKMPDLFQEAEWYLKAYNDLSISKPVGAFSVGRIPYSEICLWLNEHNIQDCEERFSYIKWVSFIDAVLSELASGENKTDERGSQDTRASNRQHQVNKRSPKL